MKNILSSNFKFIFLGLLIVEGFSFLANYFSFLGEIFFVLAVAAVLFLSIKDLKYGLWLALAELFIGSQGYLFSFDIGGASISIRMAIWVILIAVWAGKFLDKTIKKHQEEKRILPLKILKSSYFSLFLILALFIIWGGLNGFISGNSTANILFDINGWLYLALIIPLYEVAWERKDFLRPLFEIFLACVLWLALKSFFLVFVFSHNIYSWMDVLYDWVRNTGIGEVTEMSDGFTRIFFQSHIFLIIAFFVSIFLANSIYDSIIKKPTPKEKKQILLYIVALIPLATVIILSFSRSFWAGCLLGLLFSLVMILKKYGWKRLGWNISALFLVGVLSLALIIIVVKFPGVGSTRNFNAADTIKNRARSVSGEAAVSSRWNLLPELWSEIKEAPILGRGFGTTVTYRSNDPRILESTADGKYTTYAFECGWLGIWLKLGFFGLFCYIFLIGKIILDGLTNKDLFRSALINGVVVSLAVIAVINFFTPYLNHPLGLGALMLASIIMDKKRQEINT